MSRGKHTLHEECSEAYKNVNTVVAVVVQAGLSESIAKLRPLGVIKG
jgi:RNA-splicing ligase RtcB